MRLLVFNYDNYVYYTWCIKCLLHQLVYLYEES